METKKMTLKEAQEFVKNTKYIVWSEDESRQLQKKLFEFGCGWLCGGPIVSHVEHPFLLVDENLRLSYASKISYMAFEESTNTYMQTDKILNMELETEKPKPKFDPNTLQPFDKVLVRRNEKSVWLARFFEYCEVCSWDKYHVTNGGGWQYCIPYNEETKHLHRTCDDAPEFYKLD